MSQIELVLGGIFTLVGGLLMDFIGRKRTVIPAFAGLGIGYAVLSLSTAMPVSWLLYSVVDGVAWGLLTPAIMLTLWADLSPKGERERYFAFGVIPLNLGGVARAVLAPTLSSIPIYSAFSLAALLLFLATIPLLYAPETLPEKVLKHRGVIQYVKRVKKISEKTED